MHRSGQITILNELKDFIIPLTDEQFLQLEKNILSEGCRDPLIVWQKNGKLILIDGHNRYAICQKHNLTFETRKLSFSSINEAKAWMVENQMGRRNLTPDQLSYYRGVKYNTYKNSKGGYDKVMLKGKGEHYTTSQALAKHFNVSESTIKRDSKFATGLNVIGMTNAKLKLKILNGQTKVKKIDIQTLSDAKYPEKIKIRNESDLYNKAKLIREDLLNEVESKIKKIANERVSKAQKILQSSEPVFLNKEDRLKKIKGMILNSVNRAIKEKDQEAIKELKKLIHTLVAEIG